MVRARAGVSTSCVVHRLVRQGLWTAARPAVIIRPTMSASTVARVPVSAAPALRPRVALLQLAILVALTLWVFRPDISYALGLGLETERWAHTLVAPALVALLIWARGDVLRAALRGGSWSGLVLVVAGLLVAAAAVWPWQFTHVRLVMIVPVLAGVLVLTCGWRMLFRCLPILALIAISLPIPPRVYVAVTARPELLTLQVTTAALGQLPGVKVHQEGPDIDYQRAGRGPSNRTAASPSGTGARGTGGARTGADAAAPAANTPAGGTVALAEHHFGAALFMPPLAIAIFVAFARVRPLWHLVVFALAVGPIVFTCNLLRVIAWGVCDIYADPLPTSAWPRLVTAGFGLLLAYGLFGLLSYVLDMFVAAPVEPEAGAEADADDAAAEGERAAGTDHSGRRAAGMEA